MQEEFPIEHYRQCRKRVNLNSRGLLIVFRFEYRRLRPMPALFCRDKFFLMAGDKFLQS